MDSDTPRSSLTGTPPPGVVLVVDDDPAIRALARRWLEHAGLKCLEASSGDEALVFAQTHAQELDCVVLDVAMPGTLDGFDVLAKLKRDPETAEIPVVFLTATAKEEEDVIRAAEAGTADHFAKPFSGAVLSAKVRGIAEHARLDRQIRRRLAFAEQNATVDALTQLFNRRHFEKRLQEESAHARRYKRPFAILLLDLDHFKRVNDAFGHEGGDRVLVHVAAILKASVRADDIACRYGGEEFVLLLRSTEVQGANVLCNRLHELLRASPVRLGAEELAITFSAGLADACAANDFKGDGIVARADEALYRAKHAGRNRTEIAG